VDHRPPRQAAAELRDFLPKDVEVTGWIYDTTTGRLRGVE
jgi:hypothetical protein